MALITTRKRWKLMEGDKMDGLGFCSQQNRIRGRFLWFVRFERKNTMSLPQKLRNEVIVSLLI